MTVENCANFCKRNFIYAGVEFGQECCKSCFNVVHGSLYSSISDILITRFWDIRLWEYHIKWGDERFGFGL